MHTFTPPHSKWFYTFVLLTCTVGAVYQRWQGIIVFELLILTFLFGFYAQTVMTEKLSYNMIQAVAYGSIVAAIAAFAQKIPNVFYRTVSFFANANYYAYVCEIVVVLLIYAIYRYGSKPLYYAAIAANLGGIFASGCRTAWPALFCGAIVIMICFKKYLHLFILSTTSIIVGLAIEHLPRFLFPRFNSFVSDKMLRFLIWKTSIGYIKAHPLFGQGMFTYFQISVGRAHDTHAHNLILDMLVNFGIVGTSIITIFAVLFVCDLVRNLRVNPACAVALGVLAATFIHGFTDIPFLSMQSGPLIILIISLAGRSDKYFIRAVDRIVKPKLT